MTMITQVVLGNHSESIILEVGETLGVSADTKWTSARLRHPSDFTLSDDRVWTIPFNSSKEFGPFPTVRQFVIDAIGQGGRVTYTIDKPDFDYATEIGNIEPFTGSFRLKNEDMGKVFRCEDAGNVTITVPSDLIEGFNCGFIQWATGKITLASDAGATKRRGGSATSAQYNSGSLIVLKNADGASAEYSVGGDFA